MNPVDVHQYTFTSLKHSVAPSNLKNPLQLQRCISDLKALGFLLNGPGVSLLHTYNFPAQPNMNSHSAHSHQCVPVPLRPSSALSNTLTPINKWM